MVAQRDEMVGNEGLHPGLIERAQKPCLQVDAFLAQAIAQSLKRGTGVVEELPVVSQRFQQRHILVIGSQRLLNDCELAEWAWNPAEEGLQQKTPRSGGVPTPTTLPTVGLIAPRLRAGVSTVLAYSRLPGASSGQCPLRRS